MRTRRDTWLSVDGARASREGSRPRPRTIWESVRSGIASPAAPFPGARYGRGRDPLDSTAAPISAHRARYYSFWIWARRWRGEDPASSIHRVAVGGGVAISPHPPFGRDVGEYMAPRPPRSRYIISDSVAFVFPRLGRGTHKCAPGEILCMTSGPGSAGGRVGGRIRISRRPSPASRW